MKSVCLHARVFPVLVIASGVVAAPATAEDVFNPDNFVRNVQDNVRSCEELWQEVRRSDCGNQVLGFLDGGYLALGARAFSLDFNLSRDDTAARFDGGLHLTPHFSINSGPIFFEESEFGYAVSAGFEQSYALRQSVQRGTESRTADLDTYAISNILSAEASLVYSHGLRDDTPDIYFQFGVGFGIGYGDVLGRAYITENVASSNPGCDQAATDLVNGVDGAAQQVKQNCELASFHRVGLGFSGRLNLNFRYRYLLIGLETQVIQMDRHNWFTFGSKRYDFSPAINSITVAYLFDL